MDNMDILTIQLLTPEYIKLATALVHTYDYPNIVPSFMVLEWYEDMFGFLKNIISTAETTELMELATIMFTKMSEMHSQYKINIEVD